MSGKPIVEAVDLLRAFQSQFGSCRPDDDEDDAETWDRIDRVCDSLTAAQQQEHEREHLRRVALDYAREIEDEDARAAQQQGQAVEIFHEVDGVLREAQSLAVRINYSADHAEAVTLSADLRLLLQNALSIRTGLSLFRHPKWGGTAPPPSVPVGVESEPGAVRSLVAAANAVLALYPGDDKLWTLESAVRPFNATKPAECASGCPPQQVCDYCQIAALAQQPAAVDDDVRELLDAMDSGADPRAAFLRLRKRFPATQHQEPKS